MKRLPLVCVSFGAGALAVLGGMHWLATVPGPTASDGFVEPICGPQPLRAADFQVTGIVGTGGHQVLLARTAGRVRNIFFSNGQYVRAGQLLVKLTNHNFVVAPRAGFLGACEVNIGQYLTNTTPISTLSKRHFLVVPIVLPWAHREGVQSGDSARVWMATRPTRVVSGVVGPRLDTSPEDSAVEILLTSRAPFRVGERALIRLRDARQ